ncbi:MAG: DUF3800 domain-containing protein, partial [Chloroflexi bacterium]|nr:DUF3800 domain-containing protein [Chloroflexota bacterium]
MRYRLYIDESGDHTYKLLDDVSRRYLALTGIAIESDYYRTEFQPQLEALKQTHFPHSPDDPVVLHREEIRYRKGHFGILVDPSRNLAWENAFLEYIRLARFRLFTVVLDKKAHRERYGDAAIHPYHLLLTLLLERYRGYLMYVNGTGDVLAEARGGKEDMALKDAYRKLWQGGTYYISSQEFQKVLTSRELKVKRKEQNIGGLQVTDLLAYPAKQYILESGEKVPPAGATFSAKLAQVFKGKFDLIG